MEKRVGEPSLKRSHQYGPGKINKIRICWQEIIWNRERNSGEVNCKSKYVTVYKYTVQKIVST